MPLRIFEARPERVQIGNATGAQFDTEVPYMRRSSSSTIKYPLNNPLETTGDRLTYRFDGDVYHINAVISFTVNVATISTS